MRRWETERWPGTSPQGLEARVPGPKWGGGIGLLAHPQEAQAYPASFFLAPAAENTLFWDRYVTLCSQRKCSRGWWPGILTQSLEGLWTGLCQEGWSGVGWQEAGLTLLQLAGHSGGAGLV